jgi:hypothetical protein
MTRFTLALLLVFFTIGRQVSAQTPTSIPAPRPPDPQDIFAEGIEWTLIEEETLAPDPIEQDYARQVIRVFDDKIGEWGEYPFPSAVPGLQFNTDMLDNGLVRVWIHKERNEDLWPGQVFLLDPETGVYTEPPTICEGKVIRAEAGQGKWTVVYHDEEKSEAFLCQSETGEIRDVTFVSLPERAVDEWQVYPSPDQNHLVLVARQGDFYLFAYDLITEDLINLGTIRGDSDFVFSLGFVVSASRGLASVSHYYSSWPATTTYAFDINTPNSIEFAFWSWWDSIYAIQSPKRIVSVFSEDYAASNTGSYSREHKPCTLTVYDASGLHTQELGYECIPHFVRDFTASPAYQQGNFLYFLVKYSEEAVDSYLYRYDIAHDTMTELAGAVEIESILSVSPGNDYIAVLMDDNGLLDFPWNDDYCCDYTHGRQLVIISTVIGTPIYRSEPLAVYSPSQLIWTDESTVVVTSYNSEFGDQISDWLWGSMRRIRIEDEGRTIVTTSTTKYDAVSLEPSPDHQYGLDRENTLIDLRSFETITILQVGVLETYRVRMRWDQETGDLVVYVSLDSSSTKYRVALPNSTNSEQKAQ